jgi:hypothetical protein
MRIVYDPRHRNEQCSSRIRCPTIIWAGDVDVVDFIVTVPEISILTGTVESYPTLHFTGCHRNEDLRKISIDHAQPSRNSVLVVIPSRGCQEVLCDPVIVPQRIPAA